MRDLIKQDEIKLLPFWIFAQIAQEADPMNLTVLKKIEQKAPQSTHIHPVTPEEGFSFVIEDLESNEDETLLPYSSDRLLFLVRNKTDFFVFPITNNILFNVAFFLILNEMLKNYCWNICAGFIRFEKN